jgi:6-phosphogluconolactonase
LYEGIHNPTYLALDRVGNDVFAVTEFAGHGQVHHLRLEGEGTLSHIATESSHGESVCHLAMLPSGDLAVAAYSGPSLGVYPIKGGRMGSAARIFHYTGSGPNRTRQQASHPHQVMVAPGERWLYVCDLGADCVWRHEIALEERPIPYAMPAGHGPRHLAFHPDLPRAYVLGELAGAVTTCDWDPASGSLAVRKVTPTLDEEDASGAAIRIHPSRSVLYVSLRKRGELLAFPLDGEGMPGDPLVVTTEAGTARDFFIHPQGRWLISADQSANSLLILELDPATGMPQPSASRRLAVNTPVCVLFVPPSATP